MGREDGRSSTRVLRTSDIEGRSSGFHWIHLHGTENLTIRAGTINRY